MKFLIVIASTTDPRMPHPPDPGKLYESVRAWVQARLEDGTLDCAYYMVHEKGMCIMNAGSHEDLMRQVRDWPAALYSDFTIYPLADFRSAMQDRIARFQQLQSQ